MLRSAPRVARFSVIGGTITGSFAGGTASTNSSPDLATIGAFLSSTELQPNLVGTGPGQVTDGGPCQPKLTIKNKKGVESASLKAGKGIKAVGLASGTLAISR